MLNNIIYVLVRSLEPEAWIRVLLLYPTDFSHDTSINDVMYKHIIIFMFVFSIRFMQIFSVRFLQKKKKKH